VQFIGLYAAFGVNLLLVNPDWTSLSVCPLGLKDFEYCLANTLKCAYSSRILLTNIDTKNDCIKMPVSMIFGYTPFRTHTSFKKSFNIPV
jgi:hypothetical protein